MFRPEYVQKRAKQIREKKKKDEQKRKRNRILNFRVSQEELELINTQIQLTGLKKQEYFVQMLTNHEITVFVDYRVHDAIAKELFQLARIIKKFGKLNSKEDDVLLYILEIYEAIKKEKSL